MFDRPHTDHRSAAREPHRDDRESGAAGKAQIPALEIITGAYGYLALARYRYIAIAVRDYLYAISVFTGAAALDLIIYGRDGFGLAPLLPAVAFFLLRYAVRCHRLVQFREFYPEWSPREIRDEATEAVDAYTLAFGMLAIVLVVPLAPAVVAAALGVKDAVWQSVLVLGALIDVYLLVRLSAFLPLIAYMRCYPTWWMLDLSRGIFWRLLIVLVAAPLPYAGAFALLDVWAAAAPDYLRFPIFLLGITLAFVTVAVMATTLSCALNCTDEFGRHWLKTVLDGVVREEEEKEQFVQELHEKVSRLAEEGDDAT